MFDRDNIMYLKDILESIDAIQSFCMKSTLSILSTTVKHSRRQSANWKLSGKMPAEYRLTCNSNTVISLGAP